MVLVELRHCLDEYYILYLGKYRMSDLRNLALAVVRPRRMHQQLRHSSVVRTADETGSTAEGLVAEGSDNMTVVEVAAVDDICRLVGVVAALESISEGQLNCSHGLTT